MASDNPPANIELSKPNRMGWIGLLLVCLAFLPLIALHARNMWDSPHYQYFPLVWILSAWLIYTRIKEDRTATNDNSKLLSIIFIVAGFVVLFAAIAIYSPWLAMVAVILFLGGGLRLISSAHGLLPAWGLLWLTVPLPMRYDIWLTREMQSATSHLASALLDYLGYRHLRTGNVFELVDHQLFVDEACSGVNSLLGIISLVVVISVWRRRPIFIILALIAATPVWVTLVNVIRISTIVIVKLDYGIDLSIGLAHELLGFSFLPITLLFVLGTDSLLMFLFGPCLALGNMQDVKSQMSHWWNRFWGWNRVTPPPEYYEFSETNPVPVFCYTALSKLSSQLICLICTLAVVVQGYLFIAPLTRSKSTINYQALARETLPAQLKNWELDRYSVIERSVGADEGHFSHQWEFISPRENAIASFDFPFTGWHELSRCYQGTGWVVSERIVQNEESSEAKNRISHVEVNLQKPTGEYAVLFFSLFDVLGRPIAPSDKQKTLVTALRNRLAKVKEMYGFAQTTYQAQLLVVSSTPFTEDEIEQCRARFFQVTETIIARTKNGSEAKSTGNIAQLETIDSSQ